MGDRVIQQELDALLFDMLLDDRGRVILENVGQDTGREIAHRDRLRQIDDALGALEADQAGAHDQHALVAALAQQPAQALGVVERHERGLRLDAVQAVHGRHERAGAGRDAQLVIGDDLARLQRDGFRRRIDRRDGLAQHRGHAVLLVEIGWAVLQHFLLGGLAEQHVRDQRAAVYRIRLARNDGDRAFVIDDADALDDAGGGCAVADDDVIHVVHLSSYTIALLGQPCTHMGLPCSFFWHSSHFWIAPSFEVDSAPYGQDRMQV